MLKKACKQNGRGDAEGNQSRKGILRAKGGAQAANAEDHKKKHDATWRR